MCHEASGLHRISTHAPAGGATRAICGSLPACGNFYSRPCGRGDIERRLEEWRREISTHAPAGGATYNGIKIKINQMQFLLTPLREGRLSKAGPPAVS